MINRKQTIPFILMLCLSVSGCELMGPEMYKKTPLELVPVVQEDLNNETEVVYQELSNDKTDEEKADNIKTELYPGTGQFISSGNRSKNGKATGKGEYSLNFDEADLGEVAKVILSDILGENYLLGPKVAGKVTLQTSQPLSRSELLPTLDMLLDVNNAAMVYQDGVYQIKTKADAVQSSAFSSYRKYSKKVPAGYQIRVVPVKNVAVEELAEIIKPLMQQKSILHVDSGRNMMLIAGTDAELDRAMDMVNAFDIDIMKGRSFGLFPLTNVDSIKIIEELEQVFNKNSTDSKQGFFQFMAIERLNAVLAITHQAKYLKDIERWVLRLDRANTSAGGGVIVYRVQHVDAKKLSETLNEIFSGSGKKDRAASVAAGKKTVRVTNKKKKKEPKKTRVGKKSSSTSLSDIGDINIIADEVNNALIIVASAQDYAVVQQVIKELDVMPLQVLIDATIVDVTLKNNLKYGIKWFLSHSNGLSAASSGSGVDLFAAGKKLAIASATGGFSYAFATRDISAVLTAEANNGNINVISSPSLMVLNNHEASMQVGNEISLKTSSNVPLNSNVGDDNSLLNSSQIEQRKTGVKLKVTPRVNASGLVIMEIEQSVEDPGPSKDDGSNPDILTRELSSFVAVQSGETIVLGGLIKQNNNHDKTGIPFLHELPLIGRLFGSTTRNQEKTELVVLITPRVVRSKHDARLVTNEFKRKLSGIYEENMDRDYQRTETTGYQQGKHKKIPRLQ